MFRRLIASLILVLLALPALPAFAQDGKKDADKSADGAEASVVILKFETFNAEQSVMDHFYSALHDAIEAHPGMKVKPGGDATINDLVLTLGCKKANVKCLAGLSDFVDGDRIVYGSVQHSEDVYLLTLKMFDFSKGDFIRQVNDETIEGSGDEIKAGIDAVIEGFLYGDVGKLEVNVAGAKNAEVLFDGKKVGVAPVSLDKLPLGEHIVTVQTPDKQKKSQKVMLHRDKVSKVALTFKPAVAAGGNPVASTKNYAVPGWAAVGVGTVGLVAGIIGTVQVGNYNSEAQSMICGNALCPLAPTARANKLQSDMDSAYTMSVIGYSVAAVGLAAGGYLLYETYAGGAESSPTPSGGADHTGGPKVSFSLAPRTDGAQVGMRVGF